MHGLCTPRKILPYIVQSEDLVPIQIRSMQIYWAGMTQQTP
jgi:hypothetical protein